MTRETQLQIFKAQTSNVKTLDKAWSHLQRSINKDLVIDNIVSAKLNTKLLALIFSAWSEATLSKLIHTPHGLELDEIQQIKSLICHHSIVHGWKKCLELGLIKVKSSPKSSYIPNIKQKVERIIGQYVEEPSIIRNKIAHGQWDICLNSQNTSINHAITANVQDINVVNLSVWKEAHSALSNIIEALIESPDRAFHRDYWKHTVDLDEHLKKTENWTLAGKIAQLKAKRMNRPLPTPTPA